MQYQSIEIIFWLIQQIQCVSTSQYFAAIKQMDINELILLVTLSVQHS